MTQRISRIRILRGLGYLLAWLVVALPCWALLFTQTSQTTVLAGHDAVLRPTFQRHAQIVMGPYLPDLRVATHQRIGLDIRLGKTTASTAQELVARYAAIAARPEAEVDRLQEEVADLAVRAAVRAGVLGLVPIGLWLLVGRDRRRQLVGSPVKLGAGAMTVVLAGVLLAQPWGREPERVQPSVWLDVQDAIPDVRVPQDLSDWQVQGGLITNDTRRLLESAFSTFDQSKVFYQAVVDRVPEIADRLHQPNDKESVAVLVSDRHDNIGMDPVVRAVADAAGATAVIDAGDDTSTGEPWEAFSLESLDNAFKDFDHRIAIAGNHDNGGFVSRYLRQRGWTHLAAKEVTAFDDVKMYGVDDPRSSGLGNWRDEKSLSFDEVKQRIADDVCKLDADGKRPATVVVHDAKLGAEALARGCTDLVLAGHLHVQVGPDRVVGSNGKAGYSYTNGTTGGAAYAIAVGSKLRREAEFTLVTYAKGRPVGLQPVRVSTIGEIHVDPYLPLDLTSPFSVG